ncbi:hypothetical protein ACFYT4_02570 [Streptomyces sp. NPDC004609]|uniref:hypothetical protein n=1 Tax=Streptomyces sp. NPDC004609 TaxID=3364704 RepID=UPI0036AD03AB
MTAAQYSAGPRREMSAPGPRLPSAVAMGEFIFTPGWARTPAGATSTLHRDGTHIELRCSASAVEDFLAVMVRLEDDFIRLWNAIGRPSGHGHGIGRIGQNVHA